MMAIISMRGYHGLLGLIALVCVASVKSAEKRDVMPSSIATISGLYANEAAILVARRDVPRESVSLAGLMLTGTVAGKIESVWIGQERDEALHFVFYDHKLRAATTEVVTKPDSLLKTSADAVTFRRVFKSHSESGKVAMEMAYKLTSDKAGRLVVEVEFAYTTKSLLIFSTSGKDRAVYAFERLGSTPPTHPPGQANGPSRGGGPF